MFPLIFIIILVLICLLDTLNHNFKTLYKNKFLDQLAHVNGLSRYRFESNLSLSLRIEGLYELPQKTGR